MFYSGAQTCWTAMTINKCSLADDTSGFFSVGSFKTSLLHIAPCCNWDVCLGSNITNVKADRCRRRERGFDIFYLFYFFIFSQVIVVLTHSTRTKYTRDQWKVWEMIVKATAHPNFFPLYKYQDKSLALSHLLTTTVTAMVVDDLYCSRPPEGDRGAFFNLRKRYIACLHIQSVGPKSNSKESWQFCILFWQTA